MPPRSVKGKMLFQPTDEVAVILFGSTETQNAVHEECVAAGDPDAFCNISVLHPLQCPTDPAGGPNLQLLRAVDQQHTEQGASDYINAVMVGLDMLLKAVESRGLQAARKRMALISSFDYQVDELDDEMRSTVVQRLQEQMVKLEVFGVGDRGLALDPAQRQQAQEQRRSSNLSTAHAILAEVAGSYTPLAGVAEYAAMFDFKDTKPSSQYNGPLKIGTGVEIQVRVFKKTAQEKVPSLKGYDEAAAAAGHDGEVKAVREWRAPSRPDEEVAAEDLVKAFKYGRQYVPIHDEDQLKYSPERDFQILGFVDPVSIPRWYFTQECWVVVPGQDRADACAAVSALARALHNTGKIAVARYVPARGRGIVLGALQPLLAQEPEHPDALLMNQLPFAEDLRQFTFRSFKKRSDKPQLTPTPQQLAAMDQLLGAMRLTPDAPASSSSVPPRPHKEVLKPEHTVNPVLQRFYYCVGQRAVHGREQYSVVPGEQDELVAAVLDPPLELMDPAAGALQQDLQRHFPIQAVRARQQDAAADADQDGAAGGAAAGPVQVYDSVRTRTVSGVGTAEPEQDMAVLLGADQVEVAVEGMQAAVQQLVRDSIGSRSYPRAASCVAALRSACVAHQRGPQFNAYLEELRASFQQKAASSAFWGLLMEQRVMPVSEEESPGAGLSREEAEAYVRRHSGAAAAAPAPAAAKEEPAEDDFEGME